jgi:hypothetical protein
MFFSQCVDQSIPGQRADFSILCEPVGLLELEDLAECLPAEAPVDLKAAQEDL